MRATSAVLLALLAVGLVAAATAQDPNCGVKLWNKFALDLKRATTKGDTSPGVSHIAWNPIVLRSDTNTTVGMSYGWATHWDDLTGMLMFQFKFDGYGSVAVQGFYDFAAETTIPVGAGTGKFERVVRTGFTKFTMGPLDPATLTLPISFYSEKPLVKC